MKKYYCHFYCSAMYHGELNCKNGDNIFVKLGGLCNFEANPTINL